MNGLKYTELHFIDCFYLFVITITDPIISMTSIFDVIANFAILIICA